MRNYCLELQAGSCQPLDSESPNRIGKERETTICMPAYYARVEGAIECADLHCIHYAGTVRA